MQEEILERFFGKLNKFIYSKFLNFNKTLKNILKFGWNFWVQS